MHTCNRARCFILTVNRLIFIFILDDEQTMAIYDIILISSIIYWLHGMTVDAQHPSYRHYSRQSPSESIYDNQTNMSYDDDNNMCHLSVRCPSVPNLCKTKLSWRSHVFQCIHVRLANYDRDVRSRRFTVDTFLAMHGPPGPPGLPGPAGSPGPRGAVGPQGSVCS
jgi:hypothetical protein